MNDRNANGQTLPYRGLTVITDLDGTLLNDDHRVSRENLAAINELIRGGGQFGVATGRGIQSVKQLNLPGTLPSILYNGSCIVDIPEDHLVWNCPLSPDLPHLVRLLLQKFKGAAIEVFTFNGIYVSNPNIFSEKHFDLERISPLSLNGRALEEIPQPWQKIIIDWNKDGLSEIENFLRSISPEKFHIKFHRSYSFILEIIDMDCGKETALKKLCTLSHIQVEKVIAVGDNENDIAFLKQAGIGIAVDNAEEKVKNTADLILADNNHHIMDNVMKYIRQELI